MLDHPAGHIWNYLACRLTKLQLMCFEWTRSKRLPLHVTQAREVTIFMAIPALVFSCRTFDPFYMFVISTLVMSISSIMCLAWIKSFLIWWSFILVFTWVALLTFLSGLMGMLFLLALTWWEVCLLMSFVISSGRHWRLHFLGKLPPCACWKLLKINIGTIHGLGDKLFILQEKPEYISAQHTCSFWWALGKRHLGLNSIIPFINRSVSLSEACQQVKSGSSFIGLLLAKIFMLGPDNIQDVIFYRQAPWHILIYTKISTPHYDFLAFLWFR